MDFFVPMLFVCWIGGQCVEAHHQSEVFDTQDKCHQFLDTWAPEVIENLRKTSELPFRINFGCPSMRFDHIQTSDRRDNYARYELHTL